MKLHTLGPSGTDSEQAAQYYLTDETLILHNSFEEVLLHLSDYKGDKIILPVAFKSNQEPDLNWADFNYLNWSQLTIEKTFSLPLMTMGVIENTQFERNVAIVHAATDEKIFNLCEFK